jgi:hypothetical protein
MTGLSFATGLSELEFGYVTQCVKVKRYRNAERTY